MRIQRKEPVEMPRKRTKQSTSSVDCTPAKRKKLEQTAEVQRRGKSKGFKLTAAEHCNAKPARKSNSTDLERDEVKTNGLGRSTRASRRECAKNVSTSVKSTTSKKKLNAKDSSLLVKKDNNVKKNVPRNRKTNQSKSNKQSSSFVEDCKDMVENSKQCSIKNLKTKDGPGVKVVNNCQVSLSSCKTTNKLEKVSATRPPRKHNSAIRKSEEESTSHVTNNELGMDNPDQVNDTLPHGSVDAMVTDEGDDDSDDDSDDNMEWEDVQEAEGHHEKLLQDIHGQSDGDAVGEGGHSTEKTSEFKNVEISINVSGKKGKRKKTKEDLLKCIERAVNRFNKEIQVNMHKVHVLTLIARGQYRNSICSDSVLKAVCLSYVPVNMIPKSKTKWEITDLSKFLDWFRDEFPPKEDIGSIVEKQGQTIKYMKPTNQAEVFVILMRSLGLLARLVFSLQPLSLKNNGKETKNSPKPNSAKKPTKATKAGSITASKLPTKKETPTPKPSRSSKAKQARASVKNETSKTKTKKVAQAQDETSESGSQGNVDKREPTRKKKLRKRKKVDYSIDGGAVGSEEDWKDDTESESSDLEENTKQTPKSKGKGPAAKKRKGDTSSSDSLVDSLVIKTPVVDLLDDDSDFEVSSKPLVKRRTSQGSKSRSNKQILSDDSDESVKCVDIKRPKFNLGTDVWAEVYLPAKKNWICIDLVSFSVNHPEECEKKASQPVTYVLAYDNDNRIKDVTSRYASDWLSKTQKQRVDADWWEETLAPYKPKDKKMEERENSLLQEKQQDKPLPQSIGEYKNHPLYVLQRHLLKFEAIYPETAATFGFIRGESVYSRDCVHQLHTREKWMNEALVVKQGETAYKVVKGRAKKNKPVLDGKEVTIDLFGRWQTEQYKPPPAVDGKVPRNEYGNVELFQPSMLPPGTRHIKIPGIHKTAKKLGIDAVQAVTGFDFHCGFSHPILDGVVVCKEHVDTLMDAWRQEQEETRRKKEEKREKRVLGYWKLIVRSLLIRQRLKRKYENQESRVSSECGELLEGDENAPDTTSVAWPLNMQEGKRSVDTDGHCHVFRKKGHKKDKVTGEWTKSCSCGLTLPLDK